MPTEKDPSIPVCGCIAAEVDFDFFMRVGCNHARWVIIGHRIKPVELRGVPVSAVVCIQPDRVRARRCKFLSFHFLLRTIQDIEAGSHARNFLTWSNDKVRKIRAAKGIKP
jgi:hypothetical protein